MKESKPGIKVRQIDPPPRLDSIDLKTKMKKIKAGLSITLIGKMKKKIKTYKKED